MRKWIALLCALLMLGITPMTVAADSTVYTEGTLYYTIDSGSITITGCFGRDEVVTVPSTIAGIPVNTIGKGAFASNTYVKKVILPDTITSVDEGAFADGIEVVFDSKICKHKNTIIKDDKEATCKEAGYTGDTYCADCGEKLATGTVIPVTKNHTGNTEIRGKVDPTYETEGYTGDTYCCDCGAKLATGTKIDKLVHDIKPGPVYENGKWVLYDENLQKYTESGTPIVEGKKYYVQYGELKSGWLQLSNWQMYFYPETFEAAIGIVVVPDVHGEEKAFMFDKNGVEILKSRTEVIDGKKYWFQPDGSLKTGWSTLGNWVMYFYPDTYFAATGLSFVEGSYYQFNDDGIKIKEFPGKVGPQYEDEKWVLYNEDGIKVTDSGTPVVAGNKYYVVKGELKSGWLQLTSWQMYFDPETFVAATGIVEVPNKEGVVKAYMFDKNGVEVLKSRTEVIDGKKYWFQPDGSLKTGWCNLGNWTMYFYTDTYYAATGTVTIDGKTYTFNDDGVLIS